MGERYIPSGTPLTPYEREILVCLMEECAEVQQAAAKLLRFGKESRPDNGVSNREVLSVEMGDLKAVGSMVVDAGLVFGGLITEAADKKREKLAYFLQTTKDDGNG